MKQAYESWVARALPREGLTRAVARMRTINRELKNRYGPSYTKAMMSSVFIGLFLPLPGSTLLAVGAIVVVAELHRRLQKEVASPKPPPICR